MRAIGKFYLSDLRSRMSSALFFKFIDTRFRFLFVAESIGGAENE